MSLTEEQLKKEFKKLDKDNDGNITVEELRKYYLPMQEMLGMSPVLIEREIQAILSRLDLDRNGTISFDGKMFADVMNSIFSFMLEAFIKKLTIKESSFVFLKL
ncbi:unnamed protein product [Didymodactylos carnosus]|uniref:EF-hand domain-containing protein n=1 Tax=Didymodactylos carnosus TaxID=1234261 RepID=A0A814AK32_9BILA|nr:unnamed protein product [Didymodactylos carnosus]CAF1120886.1 unnamed protein product [Didymodactylos carnosus]CAF3696149.1 unnamed protein product [Didymodactylos carnosus]CAF3894693.1 unnamed protein product [Didymodactylos carnosus]